MNHRTTRLRQFYRLAIIFALLYLWSGDHGRLRAQGSSGDDTAGAPISLQLAISLLSNYRQSAPLGAVKAVDFGNTALGMVTNFSGTKGLRMYFARLTDRTLTLVLVGVDANGRDLTSGPLIDNSFSCPPFCDSTSILGH